MLNFYNKQIMKKLYFLLFSFIAFTSFGQVINEIDPDQSGGDTAEFVEILWTPNTALDGLVLVTFNGGATDDVSYNSYDLDGFSTDANGFFVIGSTNVSGVDEILPNNWLQNGADAVALYTGNDTDFPNGTLPTTTNLLSAVVYGTNDTDDAALLTALGETTQYNDTTTESIQRQGDGSYLSAAPTPDAENTSATCDLLVFVDSVTCDNITAGVDNYTTTINFEGGGTSTYTIEVTPMVGTVDLSAGDPSTDAMGTITITGVAEGTDFTINFSDTGVCNLDLNISSPECVPSVDLPITDDFTYSDGSLVGNGLWAGHSGNAGDLQVVSGQALVQHGAPSEDANIEFTAVSGVVYYAFDFTVNDPGNPIGTNGTDFEYFAHFMNNGSNFAARLDIVAPAGGGDYTVGIASDESTADATWATDFTFGTTYRAVVGYDQDANIAQLWINPTTMADTSILGEDRADPGVSVNQFALRQSDSSENEGILVDNLVISQTFSELTLSNSEFEVAEFSIYPNPVTSGFVNITSNQAESLAIEVYDILGKQVKSETITNNRLDVSNLGTGIYIVKLTQNGASVTKKLVIR